MSSNNADKVGTDSPHCLNPPESYAPNLYEKRCRLRIVNAHNLFSCWSDVYDHHKTFLSDRRRVDSCLIGLFSVSLILYKVMCSLVNKK